MSDLLSRARDAEDLDCPCRDCGPICQGELIRELADEIEQLREENQLLKLERDELVRHEERMHADIGAILGSDTSLVDAASRAVTEIKRLQTDRNRYEDQLDRLREWVAAVEDGYDKQKAEIERLRTENKRLRADKYTVWSTHPDC